MIFSLSLFSLIISLVYSELTCRPGMFMKSVDYAGDWVVRCCTKLGDPRSKVCGSADPQNYVLSCNELFGIPIVSDCNCGKLCNGLVFRRGFKQTPTCNGTCTCTGSCCALGAPCKNETK